MRLLLHEHQRVDFLPTHIPAPEDIQEYAHAMYPADGRMLDVETERPAHAAGGPVDLTEGETDWTSGVDGDRGVFVDVDEDFGREGVYLRHR